MGFADNLKGIVDKGKELAAENSDKIEDVVDKAGDFIDNKTGGKYADKVDKVQDAAKKAIPDKP
ncbi:antitoxin [Rhodococcus sp. P1Y]|uniref:antitoxin n=1 Tax=Rhodococcus sp. P1Y TaxID=1302308 RepID=UPI000EAD2409|nr:antitoxin [Rhodococcus sp. P1Y]AYJ48643.1 antitoxin [Rhodococcus sp. P1Y]